LSCSKSDSIEIIETGQEDSTVLPYDGDGDGITVADGDCDDANAEIFPGQTESCNGLDDNCNDLIDEGFPDTDKDSLADCLDEEECDGLDNDGDGEVDEDFPDVDGDGVADCLSEEICDGIDNDGDGEVDEGFDQDGDGYTTCNSDCDDTDASVHPGAQEHAENGKDDDCDGITDESAWQQGTLRIVEIMNNPRNVGDPQGEWIELFNSTSGELDLYGLELRSTDGDSYVISESLALASEGYIVLASNPNFSQNGGVAADHAYADVHFSNESDDISIVMDGVTIDNISWDNGTTMPDPDGASIMLDPWGYTNGATSPDRSYWCAATTAWATDSDLGSPGAENELCSTFDHDGDGMSGEEGDCNDLDPDIYLNAPEIDVTKDNDCDGDVELMPTAVASYDGAASTLDHCDGIYLIGSSSWDPDNSPNGGALTYNWELTAAPSNSVLTTADIEEPTDADPVFIPDVGGSYVFTLTVNDGGTNSFPVSLALSVTTRNQNSTPMADAGANQTYSESVTCTSTSYGTSYECDDCEDTDFSLSASGSVDADGDEFEYVWSVLSGNVTLDDSTISDPTATFTGPTAEYDSTNSETGRLGLTLTDCYGATSSMDTVILRYNCTGI